MFKLESSSELMGATWQSYSNFKSHEVISLISEGYPLPPTVRVSDPADVGMKGFYEEFYTFEEFLEWYQQNSSKFANYDFTYTDLTNIKIDNENNVLYCRSFDPNFELNSYLEEKKNRRSR